MVASRSAVWMVRSCLLTAVTPCCLLVLQLPALVEHTPALAVELLLRLMHSRRIHTYFQVLYNALLQ